MRITPDRQLGEFGEQEVRSRLERALLGASVRFSGFADEGIDLVLQFVSPAPDKQPIHFGVQVKTGNSFAESVGSHWKIKNVEGERFKQWTKSKLPILFVWVQPANPAQCYRAVIRKNTSKNHFLISKKANITPSIRFDLALEYGLSKPEPNAERFHLLRPPLSSGIRPFAKDFYRRELMSTQPVHPLIGTVKFSWRGWRHLTKQGRPLNYIHRSLQLLSLAPWAIENPDELIGMRRLSTDIRGAWTTEVRLIVFRCNGVEILSRPPQILFSFSVSLLHTRIIG